MLALNEDASVSWLSQYAPYVGPLPGGQNKQVAITYPMLFDSTGLTFAAYQTGGNLLPSIFLIDQTGKIQLRFDVANEPSAFEEHLDTIIAKIDELLANPPPE